MTPPALLRLDAHFTINISGQSLGDEDFTGFLEQRLHEYALPPRLLSFEINETAECIESEAIQTAVGTLGVDFGQGFAIGRPRPFEQVLQDLLRGSAGVVRPVVTARPHRLVS